MFKSLKVFLYLIVIVCLSLWCFSFMIRLDSNSSPQFPMFRQCPRSMNKYFITSASLSTYDILNQPKVGDFLRIRIQAVSTTNCSQHVGGDFWFAVLRALNTTGSSSSPVVDHRNGSYSVDLFVGWSGYVAVDITLVHPSVATRYLDRVTNISEYPRMYWNGKFSRNVEVVQNGTSVKQTLSKTLLCYLRYHGPDSWKDKCAFTSERTLGKYTAWVCDKPNNGLTCDDLVSYTTNGTLIGQTFRNISSEAGRLMDFFQGDHYMQQVTDGPQILQVQTDGNDMYTHTSHLQQERTKKVSHASGNNIPRCDDPEVGYWKGSKWNTLSCSIKQWKHEHEIGECFRNKSVYLLGDSTTRQWASTLLNYLHQKYTQSNLLLSYRKYFTKYNFNFTFQFYPHLLGSKIIPIDKQKFEVDILDSLRDARCNYIVTISPWAHFAQWWLPAYKERIRLISDAIRRTKKRCPNAPIVVKSPHVRNHGSIPQNQFMNSDYIQFQIKTIMEEMLKIDGVYYIDVWNMNLAYPAEKNVHMPAAVVRQELNIFLSYICPNIDELFHVEETEVKANDKVSGILSKVLTNV